MMSILNYNQIMSIIKNYKSPFIRFVKKAHKPLQLAIEDAVDVVCDNPSIGEAKVQDLQGIFVHKWRFNRQEYLMAYKKTSTGIDLLLIDFYQVGTHENFYDDLKKYLKDET
jgi:hypothetical protein